MKISIFYDHIKQACEQSFKSEEKMLSFVQKCNIDAVEINHWQLKNDFSILERLKNHNLQVSCVYEFYDWNDTKNLEKLNSHIEIAKKSEAKKILVVPPFFDDNFPEKEQIFKIKEFLQTAVNLTKNQNITVLLEDFDNEKSPCAKIAQLKYFFEKIPNLKLCFDMGNFCFSDENVLDAFAELKNYIFHVHCKDRGYENGKNLKNNKGLASVPTGFGYLPIKKLILKILETGYDDYFAIEHFDAYDQQDYIKKSSDFMKEFKNLKNCKKE